MERIFKEGDLVIAKDVGTACMKVIEIGYDFDEEANIHFTAIVLNTLAKDDNKPNIIDDNFNEDEHRVYYATCEWRDNNNEKHIEKIAESKLEFCQPSIPWTPIIVEGFTKGNKIE